MLCWDGGEMEKDLCKIWKFLVDNYYLFVVILLCLWLDIVFYDVFGLWEMLCSDNVMYYYDYIIV